MRHLPLTDVHPYAALAAEAAEAAAAQGKFWEMHDLLFAGAEPQLHTNDLTRYAWDLGLDVTRFERDLRTGRFASRVARDVASAEASGVAGTPTFFINEHRYQEAIDELQRAKATFGAHPDVLTYLGFASRKLHCYDVAEAYYRQALAVAPNHKGATEYYGELMVERGDGPDHAVAARQVEGRQRLRAEAAGDLPFIVVGTAGSVSTALSV